MLASSTALILCSSSLRAASIAGELCSNLNYNNFICEVTQLVQP
jgi:hypothetical protein